MFSSARLIFRWMITKKSRYRRSEVAPLQYGFADKSIAGPCQPVLAINHLGRKSGFRRCVLDIQDTGGCKRSRPCAIVGSGGARGKTRRKHQLLSLISASSCAAFSLCLASSEN